MKKLDVAGLAGFTISGLFFVFSSLRAGDVYALAGSIVWIISCLVWMVALVRST